MQQMGYGRDEALKYAKSFDDMTVAINNVPRNLTISANLSPADRAIAEFNARNRNGRGVSAPINVPISSSFNDAGVAKAGRAASIAAHIANLQAQLARVGYSVPIKQQIDYLSRLLNSGNYYTGGYTGAGGKYEPAGIVHRGEYVVPKNQVDQSTGLPYASVLGGMLSGYRSYSSGSGGTRATPTVMMVELSPVDRKILADSGSTVVLIDGKQVAASVNKANANSSNRGQ